MSNTFKGTKGKWVIYPTEAKREDGHPLFHDIVVEELWGTIASTHVNRLIGVTPEQDKANALLISHAPEMLEMLEDLVYWFEHDESNMDDQQYEAICKAKDLITRATTI